MSYQALSLAPTGRAEACRRSLAPYTPFASVRSTNRA